MHAYLKQSTASQTRVIGPFVDDTDFKTAETALSIANTDVKLSKNGGASANKNSGGGTHIANGMYALTFDATDTNTVGELSGSISMSGALVVPFKFTVLEEAIYDALFGASAAGFDANGRVDVAKIAGTAQTARDIGASVLLSSGTGTGQLSLSSGLVTVGTNNDKTGYSLTATTGLGNQTANITGNISGSVGSVSGAVGSVTGTVGGIAGTITTLDALDTAQDSQHATTQSAISGLNDIAATDIVSNGAITTLAGAVVNVDTVDTCTTNSDMRGTDSALLASSAPANFGDLAITVTTGLVSVGTNSDKTGYSISGTKTTLDALNDIDGTGLATSAGLATVDSNVDAIKAKTDQFVFTVANQVDANALSGAGGLDAAGVRAAVGLASANLDTQLGDIPTVSEFNARTLLSSAYFDASTDSVNLAADQSGVTIGTVNAMAGTITTLDALDTAQDAKHTDTRMLLESHKAEHSVQGNIYYVDPVGGDTHANGNRGGIADPYASIQDCHDNAVTDSNHDLIYLISGAAAGVTTSTENVTISKRYCQVRGPGRDFIVQAATNTDTFTITADGVELAGFRIKTTGAGSGKGVQATGVDFFGMDQVWLEDTQGDAVNVTNCTNAVIKRCSLQGAGQSGSGDGISIIAGTGQNSSYCRVLNNFIENTAGDAITIDTTGSGTIDSTSILGNKIFNSTGSAIDIVDSGTSNTVVADNRFAGNAFDFTNASTSATYTNNEDILREIVLDTVNGSDGDPGTHAQPVATVARAKVLADDLSKRIFVISGSSFTLGSAFDSYEFLGTGYTVALGGQSISGTRFNGATISGTGTGANAPVFFQCDIGTTTLPPSRFNQCRFTSTLTVGSAGAWVFDFCESGVAGLSSPTVNANSTDNNTLDFTNWARGLTLSGLAANDVVTTNGVFNTLTLNGVSATVNVSGQYGTLTNNLTGSPTVSTTNAFKAGDVASILTDTNELQTDDVPGLIAALNDIDGTGLTVDLNANQAGVTIGTVNAIAGTITTLDALDTAQDSQHATTQSAISGLNDIAATDIVSNGAITTLAGAVVNVDTVDTCTTNSDMRGTDGANTTAPDNASIAAILTDTGTTIPATLGTPTGADLATDISNISAGSGLTAEETRTALGLATANLDTQLGNIKTDTGNLVTRITSSLFSGITSMASWLGIIAGKTADASTLTEVNATTAGANYDNTRESQEAIRDRGDSAWTTGSVSGNVTITPLGAGVEQRVSGTTISLYTGEVKATTISVSDSAGSAVDLSGLTLELAIEDHAGTDVQVIADGSITRSGASNENATFTNSAAVTSTERVLRWSLRDITTGNEVLARGNIVVTRAGAED